MKSIVTMFIAGALLVAVSPSSAFAYGGGGVPALLGVVTDGKGGTVCVVHDLKKKCEVDEYAAQQEKIRVVLVQYVGLLKHYIVLLQARSRH